MEKFTPAASERPEKYEKAKQVKRALFGAVLSILPANVEAMEFPKSTDWFGGAVRFEAAAKSEQKEYAGLYLTNREGGTWVNPVEGGKDHVAIDVRADEIKILETLISNGPANALTVCLAHNHPLDLHNEYLDIPSIADINAQIVYRDMVDGIKQQANLSMQIEVNGMMYDQHGVWYYQVTDRAVQEVIDDADQGDASLMAQAQELTDVSYYVTNGKHNPMILEDTIQAFAQRGVTARFVEYDDFYKEPPCAGPNYNAE